MCEQLLWGVFFTFGFNRSKILNFFFQGGKTKGLHENNKDRVRFFLWNHMH